MRAARNSATRSRCDMECLLELLERPVEARCAVGGGDPQDARRGGRVEIEHDAQGDDFTLARGENPERGLEVGGKALGELLVDPLGRGGELLAAYPALLGAEVVECDSPRNLAEPGPG